MSSRIAGRSRAILQGGEDVARHVTFEATHDLDFAHSFSGSAAHVFFVSIVATEFDYKQDDVAPHWPTATAAPTTPLCLPRLLRRWELATHRDEGANHTHFRIPPFIAAPFEF